MAFWDRSLANPVRVKGAKSLTTLREAANFFHARFKPAEDKAAGAVLAGLVAAAKSGSDADRNKATDMLAAFLHGLGLSDPPADRTPRTRSGQDIGEHIAGLTGPPKSKRPRKRPLGTDRRAKCS